MSFLVEQPADISGGNENTRNDVGVFNWGLANARSMGNRAQSENNRSWPDSTDSGGVRP